MDRLPPEVVAQVAAFLRWCDLCAFSQTCTAFRALVRGWAPAGAAVAPTPTLALPQLAWFREWHLLGDAKGDVPTPSSSHSCASLGSQMWIYGGGTHNEHGFVEVFGTLSTFDLATREWSLLTKDFPKLSEHTLCEYAGALWTFGGTNGTMSGYSCALHMFQPIKTLFAHSTAADVVKAIPVDGVTPPERSSQVAAVFDNKLVIFGGWNGRTTLGDAWCFDFTTCTWTEVRPQGDTPSPRRTHSAVTFNNKMYVFGGFYHDKDTSVSYNDVYELDLRAGRWKLLPAHGCAPCPRGRAAMAVDPERQLIFVVGGWNRTEYFSDMYVYSLRLFEWQRVPCAFPPSLRGGLCQHSLCVCTLPPSLPHEPTNRFLVLYGGFAAAAHQFSNAVCLLRL
eukprot:TRINITY_DN3289_c0_g1_i2.p1 TRINITY_DN3289_c0_g1~~TRINITY_DN3289_c0_g1_i2.p1  ORF type:complete len:393 (-),score=99.86 TRINITY_DN3289_c0_g1_i2:881-2059(-)